MGQVILFYLSHLSAVIIILSSCLQVSLSTDDYEYLANIYSQQERQLRSPSGNNVRFDGLYSIQSATKDLYLTARSGYTSLGPVLLKKWADSASQLWDITKFETSRGYNLKPLANEFNIVTSTLKNNAHAYNAWEFKVQGDKHYVIFNTLNKRCLQTSTLKDVVQFEKCQPDNKLQHWKLNKYE